MDSREDQDDSPPQESIEIGPELFLVLVYRREWPRYVVEWSVRRCIEDLNFPLVDGRVVREPAGDRPVEDIWREAGAVAVGEARAAAGGEASVTRADESRNTVEALEGAPYVGARSDDSGDFDYQGRAQAVETARLANNKAADAREEGGTERWKAWEKTIDPFWTAVEQAYPSGFWEDFDLLKRRDVRGLESAVRFLEADPWFFRSGYIKGWLIRYINRVPLTPEYQARLQQVVLNAIRGRDRREFLRYCRLARKVLGPGFRLAVATLAHDRDAGVRRRAQWVLDALDGKTASSRERAHLRYERSRYVRRPR